MARTGNALAGKVAALPETPGVYLFKDAAGRTIYIGKAKSLRDRVGTYFHPSYAATDPRIEMLVRDIADVEVVPLPTEVDALLAEARLIKDVHPTYNARQKDDRSFLMLEITATDDYPKVWIVRETDPAHGERFGPFVGSNELRDAAKILQRVFRFATCELEIRDDDPKRRFVRPCLLHAIHRCTGPCGARVERERYLADVDGFRRFLRGDRAGLLADLDRRMKEAAAGLDFERAAELRDQVRALRSLDRHGTLGEYLVGDITPIHPEEGLRELARALNLAAPPRRIEGVDIAVLGGKQAVGSLVSFVGGVPFKPGYRRYRIRSVTGMDDFAMVREVVTRRLRRLRDEGESAPDVLLIDGGPGQLSAATAAVERVRHAPGEILALAKREETLFRRGHAGAVAIDPHSPGLRLLMYVRDEAHRFAQHYHHVLRRKAVLEPS